MSHQLEICQKLIMAHYANFIFIFFSLHGIRQGGVQIEVHNFGGMIVLCNSKIEILFTLSNYLEYALK